MFFVSEEFLRKYEEDGAIDQTIGAAVPSGEELFGDEVGKRARNLRHKRGAAKRPPRTRKEKRSTQDKNEA